ncbi:MAG: acyltransferase domain-containing protein, partial [Anaerolineae bacterium]|nr:acyltransferase domain-containing protein [Anaerolineae bacterium]
LAATLDEVEAKYAEFAGSEQARWEALKIKGIYAKVGQPTRPAEIALLFPGQASQYPHMLRGLYECYQPLRAWFTRADAYWLTRRDHTVTSLIYPPASQDEAAWDRLRETQNAHPSIFITSYALYDLLRGMGLRADHMVGHSLGEITALAAAEKLSFQNALRLVEQRGYAFHETPLDDPGKMIAVAGSLEQVEEHVKASGLDVSIANINGPRQIIVAGSSEQIERLADYLRANQVRHKLLYVSHAFHSPLIEPVADRFLRHIVDIPFQASDVEVMMNHRGVPYPNTPNELERMPELLREQILQPVRFVDTVNRLYDSGVRLFVEVGPGSVLSGLVRDILSDKPATILTANPKGGDDLTSLLKLLGGLFVEGVPIAPWPTQNALANPPMRSAAASQASPPAAAAQPAAAPPTQREPLPAQAARQGQGPRRAVVYSGVAIGLPGSYKASFRDDNFEQLFAGHSLIERLTDDERQKLVDLRISKLVKSEAGPSFKLLSSLDEVIQLAGKIGQLDLTKDYHLDERDVQNMSTCIAHAVAAGYEALRDAGIPLVREYIRTSSGKLLPQKRALPKEMQEDTGVIFANGFPMIDPVIREVSRYISYHMGKKTRDELMAFYQGIIARVRDDTARKLLTDWYALYYGRLTDRPGEEELYQFNYHLMSQISAQANNRLASLINAKGPNCQVNAACSSTSVAITMAEDFIRSGRVKRMIVIGADDPTSKVNLPWLGAGFLASGAATTEGDLYKAAVPFDLRRNGMIVSAGAVGLVLETKEEAERRGMVGVAELLGTHAFNTAKDPTQIDPEQSALEMDKFMSRMEREYGLKRDELAGQLLYLAHETYTPPRGGCAQTEAIALQRTFGDRFSEVLVGNTKGMTGHTMGASLEDAVAARALQVGRIPPVVNHAEPDPLLAGLNLSKGGSHERTYALKMSAGFGSQGHLALLKRTALGVNRIVDRERYADWLRQVAGQNGATLQTHGRLLVLASAEPPAEPTVHASASVASEPVVAPSGQSLIAMSAPIQAADQAASLALDQKASSAEVIEFIAQMTQYPPEMLEAEME